MQIRQNWSFHCKKRFALNPGNTKLPWIHNVNKDAHYMQLALRLARRGYGATSPNPMVGAVLVKGTRVIGRGWHHRAGLPHAEIEALRDAQKHGHNPRGATLYVTLEPCSTHGRTPPCTDAIIAAGIKRVVIGATDPNPNHAGRAFKILKRAGIKTVHGILGEECARLNEAFNHWIVHGTPFVTVKAGMTLDGKIATASGESRWITGPEARDYGMKMRQGMDAILVGVNTILADDPSLTFRPTKKSKTGTRAPKQLRRIILDSLARTSLTAKVVSDEWAHLTTIVVSKHAPKQRVAALAKRVNVIVAPLGRAALLRSRTPRTVGSGYMFDLRWLLKKLGSQNTRACVTSLLVEGGGETNASFLFNGLAQRVMFFYAPKIMGGRDSRKGVAGEGATRLSDAIQLQDVEWKKIGGDLAMTATVTGKQTWKGHKNET
jgi:diaminohydroxyphosphoribosylaminopyrimidine deaminase/5-amino-6-(5-phosphoribosylamino)uracil reductase